MTSLYASIIRTSKGDVFTEIQMARDYLENVLLIRGHLEDSDTEVMEVHMCAVAEVIDEPTEEQMAAAESWIKGHLK